MSEMAQALRMLGKLPKNVLIQFPSGRWGFVGSVHGSLAYVREDGTEPTAEQFGQIRSFGVGFVKGCKERTFATREEAEEASAALAVAKGGNGA